MGLCIQSWLQLTKSGPGWRQLHPASTCSYSHPPSRAKEVSPMQHPTAPRKHALDAKIPMHMRAPLSSSPSSFLPLTDITLADTKAPVTRSAHTHIAHLTVEHPCRPTPTPHLALTCAMLRVSYAQIHTSYTRWHLQFISAHLPTGADSPVPLSSTREEQRGDFNIVFSSL